ncbi:hypothetical protein Godav_019660 [Gossypium davidsonii]|uniref:Uncharacterized protein n=2 Tax=Gossypium TaxID=3633 RepID=A0A7J8R0I3_GOSDV|nr:hypothetical protein [Gossypium davidsonii]MBA0671551.1 hypothetical protein [Gossypium klotzschianum]
MILCREILTLVQYHKWEQFRVTPKDFFVFSVVQEYHASFTVQESRRPEGANWETMLV